MLGLGLKEILEILVLLVHLVLLDLHISQGRGDHQAPPDTLDSLGETDSRCVSVETEGIINTFYGLLGLACLLFVSILSVFESV